MHSGPGPNGWSAKVILGALSSDSVAINEAGRVHTPSGLILGPNPPLDAKACAKSWYAADQAAELDKIEFYSGAKEDFIFDLSGSVVLGLGTTFTVATSTSGTCTREGN